MASPPIFAAAGVDIPIATSQILSTVVHLLGVSIISFCLGRRTVSINDGFFKIRGWFNVSLARLAVILVFIDSWLFLFSSGILANGIGLLVSSTACSAAILLCIVFYVTSKLFIYLFLAERVYIVWTAATSIRRQTCGVYRICVGLIVVYAIIIATMFFGRIAIYNSDRTCVIGLKQFASVPLLSYDLVLNLFMTSLFIIPIWRDAFTKRGLKLIAIRTLISAAVALTTSTVNILILAILGGHEAAWLCLAACSTDVAINALALFWVTASPPSTNNSPLEQKSPQGRGRVSFTPVHIPISFLDPDPSFNLWSWGEDRQGSCSIRRPSGSKESSIDFAKFPEPPSRALEETTLGLEEKYAVDDAPEPDMTERRMRDRPSPFVRLLGGNNEPASELFPRQQHTAPSSPSSSFLMRQPAASPSSMTPIPKPLPTKTRPREVVKETCFPIPLPYSPPTAMEPDPEADETWRAPPPPSSSQRTPDPSSPPPLSSLPRRTSLKEGQPKPP